MRNVWFPIACAGILFSFFALLGCAPKGPAPLSTYRMGDRATVGPLIYNVIDAQWYTQLGTGLSARIPVNRFFVVRFSVLNSGAREYSVPPLTLHDESGASYLESTDGTNVPQWVGYLRRVRPAETLLGNIVFDVPPREYKIRLEDDGDGNQALVDIPLAFRSDVPNIIETPDIQLDKKEPNPEDLRK